jgi:hypothetical protein
VKKTVVALLSLIVVGLMLVPNVSAGKSVIVTFPDREGDIGKYNVFITTISAKGVSGPEPTWGGEAQMLDVGYADMVSQWIGKVKDNYVFGMELAGDLPTPGDPLPPGIRYAGWEFWVEYAPWTPTSGGTTLFIPYLEYHDSAYHAALLDASDYVTETPISFTIDGNKFQIVIPAALMGNLDSFWWSSGVYVAKEYIWAPPWFTDLTDVGISPDQVNTDFPWPLP